MQYTNIVVFTIFTLHFKKENDEGVAGSLFSIKPVYKCARLGSRSQEYLIRDVDTGLRQGTPGNPWADNDHNDPSGGPL